MPTVLDFDRSTLQWRTLGDSAGSWKIVASSYLRGADEARTVLTPIIMAGDVYGRERLPLTPAYSFQLAAGPSEHVIWRDYGTTQRDSTGQNAASFRSIEFSPGFIERRHVDLNEIKGGGATLPLTCRITATASRDQIFVLEFPVCHINIRLGGTNQSDFQVETEPILVPAQLLPATKSTVTGGFALAYVFLIDSIV